MISDKEQTRLLRLARVEEKRAIKDLNQTGRRLEWVRLKLDLSQREVCEATGIPTSSYCGREGNIRAELVEEYLVLSTFFNKLWQSKYREGYPFHNGSEVRKISVEWLLFGHNDVEENADLIIKEYQIKIREMEQEYFNKEAELLRQLDMFSREE